MDISNTIKIIIVENVRQDDIRRWLLICGDPRECFFQFGEVQTFDCSSDIFCHCRMRKRRCGGVVPLVTALLTLLVPIYRGKYIHVTCTAL